MAFEFHVSKAARDRYEFDRALFQTSGNVIIPDFPAARAFARRMNERADAARYPDRVVHAAELNAMGLIDEISHHAIEIYRRTVNPNVMADAMAALVAQLPPDRLDHALARFVEEFPPLAVYRDGQNPADYLAGETEGHPNREIALEEMLLLWLANVNPAFMTFDELFDDADLTERTDYEHLIAGLQRFFEDQPGFGREGQSLIAFLRAPALAEPDSLAGQLRFIRSRWGLVLTSFMDRLIVSLDVLHEDEVALWMRMHPTPGPAGATHGPGLGGIENEYERFSQDRDWMPRVVLMARTTYVWLDQLSKRYGRWIHRLDEIPDEELDVLARRGFTALWLIGLWERSRASQRIKQWRGNPEAAASAYSLMDYTIADDLGGEEAFAQLRNRCSARGIRLSSDMVPNHMGIDSRWVIEHPDWFLQLPDAPYPAYSFSGGNLSDDERVTIQIEDHYWDASDAAVVFKRTDTWSGEARYIYHGNDGTSMPWNDTAQLDYLQAEVREAVIQTILHVARRFPIIRFDAAMTLARRHIQRLWFPEPGQGGAIPSRAEHAISRAVFDELMPNEFWREVVDRVAAEVPDTLLLAEAFWLLEGYFVRTLGMHRVYNSAFMNMLRDEDNASYRRVVKDTIEFDPEVLKRFVNFMSNPDERTAVDQFGKGDKYFGVATLLATMPGLPMIGHGQIEGFAEKYGMEYRRAYRDEEVDCVARRTPRARDLPALPSPLSLRRRSRLPSLRRLRPGRLGQRGRLRVLESRRRRALADRLSQPLCRGARLDQGLGRLLRAGRRRERRAAAAAAVPGRGAGAAPGRRLVHDPARAAIRPGVHPAELRPVPRRDVRRPARLRLPGLPRHPRDARRAFGAAGAAGRTARRRRRGERLGGAEGDASRAPARRGPRAGRGGRGRRACATDQDRSGAGRAGLLHAAPRQEEPGGARPGRRPRRPGPRAQRPRPGRRRRRPGRRAQRRRPGPRARRRRPRRLPPPRRQWRRCWPAPQPRSGGCSTSSSRLRGARATWPPQLPRSGSASKPPWSFRGSRDRPAFRACVPV